MSEHRMAEDRSDEYMQSCGHPVSDVVSADEGTSYCAGCEREARPSAATDALDDIRKLIGAPDWEYPGQVVRDVAMELGIPLDEMARRLSDE